VNPILLIHGYSAEHGSDPQRRSDITNIYGSLPAALRRQYGKTKVFELNVSRYISLADGINLDDLAAAMQQALQADFPELLTGRFDVIIHSTGALLVRNWLRRHSPRPGPIEHLVYLAGANFGSGWAHVGRGQLAKWGRAVFQGSESGLQILDALELGAEETLDLQQHFLAPQHDLWQRYRLREFCICGSQVLSDWLPIPVRYAREDGSDGVVRVASCNTDWNYIAVQPKRRAHDLAWEEIRASCALLGSSPDGREDDPGEYYRVATQVLADELQRPPVPLAIPYQCAHSGSQRGVVTGKRVRAEVLALIDVALRASTPAQYRKVGELYAGRSRANQQRAAAQLEPGRIAGIFFEPRAQYDAHAQLIFRLRDQHGRPVEDADVLLNSSSEAAVSINELFEHAHRNRRSPHILCFYLRTSSFDKQQGDWLDRLAQVGGIHLGISPTEARTEEIRYLPVCLKVSAARLRRFIQGHRTTVIDVTLLRIPSPQVFKMVKAVTS
jgi:hypothetical protein